MVIRQEGISWCIHNLLPFLISGTGEGHLDEASRLCWPNSQQVSGMAILPPWQLELMSTTLFFLASETKRKKESLSEQRGIAMDTYDSPCLWGVGLGTAKGGEPQRQSLALLSSPAVNRLPHSFHSVHTTQISQAAENPWPEPAEQISHNTVDYFFLMINVSGSDKIHGQHFLSLIPVIQGKAAAGTHAAGADKGAQISVWYTCVHQMSWTWLTVLLLTSHSWYLSQLLSKAYLHPLEFTYSMNKVKSQVERGPRCVRGGFHSVKPGYHLV